MKNPRLINRPNINLDGIFLVSRALRFAHFMYSRLFQCHINMISMNVLHLITSSDAISAILFPFGIFKQALLMLGSYLHLDLSHFSDTTFDAPTIGCRKCAKRRVLILSQFVSHSFKVFLSHLPDIPGAP